MRVDSSIELVSDIVPLWAKRTPDAVAVVEDGRQWTWSELHAAIGTAAEWLGISGVRPGDRLMLVCENCAAAVVLYFASVQIGAWPALVNARLSEREIEEIREHSGARRMIFTTQVSLRARQHAERYGARSVDPAGIGTIALGALNESSEPEPCHAEAAENIAALIYTSGTTGRPKGVMLSHKSLMFVATTTAKARRLGTWDRVFAVLPVSHILGLTGVLLGSLVSGSQVQLVSRFDPGALLFSLRCERLSVVIGTPAMYAMVAEYAARKALAPIAAPALRLISAAGAPLDAATKEAAERAFGRVLHNGYGITECGPSISLTSLDHPRTDCSVGRLLDGVQARLVDACGRDGAAGEVGELWVRTPGAMTGYFRAPHETAEVMGAERWFKTGDLARETDGNYFIVGRVKEMVVRFGYNVYPAEIEGVLNAHPAVSRAAVLGHVVEGREELAAFVQLRSGARATTDELAGFAAARLAPYKHPSRFVVLDAMPMSAGGKIRKSELPALLGGHRVGALPAA